jgi:hypothetical protein
VGVGTPPRKAVRLVRRVGHEGGSTGCRRSGHPSFRYVFVLVPSARSASTNAPKRHMPGACTAMHFVAQWTIRR